MRIMVDGEDIIRVAFSKDLQIVCCVPAVRAPKVTGCCRPVLLFIAQ